MKFYPHVTDQIAHFVVGAAILLTFALGGLIGGVVAGLACGLIRELTEAGGSRIALAEIKPHFEKLDPWIDLLFWSLGGAAASLVVWTFACPPA
jgi:hypothetical protein